MYLRLPAACSVLLLALALLPFASRPAAAQGAANTEFAPVTNEMLENPAAGDWLMWRRTQNGWGYSPLDQIDRDNVDQLRMVWTRALREGTNQATPIAYGGALYVPNPSHATQAIDARTGDLLWEYVRPIPEDANDYIRGLVQVNRSAAIYGNLIIDTANDGYVYALDAQTGRLVWETEILNLRELPARHSTGPIIANGMVVSGRSCRPWAGPEACIIAAHDPRTGAEVWRTRLIPAPGEPGNETWGDVPYEERGHVGSWMAPSYDPDLNLIYVGTSVTSPAPKFLLGGADNRHLYHNSTLALDGDTGEIRWYYQNPKDGQ